MNNNEIQAEINALKQLLERTDYLAIKHSEGLISEEDYSGTKAERQAWRNQINELEALLVGDTEGGDTNGIMAFEPC